MPERLTRGLERGREKSKRTWSFSSNRCRNVSPVSRRRNAYTPSASSVDEGNNFWSRKISLKRKSIISRSSSTIPEISHQFQLHFLKLLLLFSAKPCPSTNPRAIIGQCQYLVTGIYRRVASRRQPSPVYSPVAGPFYSLPGSLSSHGFRPLSTSSW